MNALQPPSGRSFDVICFGMAIVDVLTHAQDAFLDRHSMVKGSMDLIDTERALRIYGDMPPAIEISGGSAANTAVGIASFGRRSAFVGKVADDELGDVFAHDIRAARIGDDGGVGRLILIQRSRQRHEDRRPADNAELRHGRGACSGNHEMASRPCPPVSPSHTHTHRHTARTHTHSTA